MEQITNLRTNESSTYHNMTIFIYNNLSMSIITIYISLSLHTSRRCKS